MCGIPAIQTLLSDVKRCHPPPAPLSCSFLAHIPVWTSFLLDLHPTSISGCISLEAQDTCFDTQTSSGQVEIPAYPLCSFCVHFKNISRRTGCRKVISVWDTVLMTVFCEDGEKETPGTENDLKARGSTHPLTICRLLSIK